MFAPWGCISEYNNDECLKSYNVATTKYEQNLIWHCCQSVNYPSMYYSMVPYSRYPCIMVWFKSTVHANETPQNQNFETSLICF